MDKKIDVKIGTKEEVYWTDLKEKCLESIEAHRRAVIIDSRVLKLCEEKIEEEKKVLNTKAP